MRDKEGFNSWAEAYGKDVRIIESSGKYPFAGYEATLGQITNIIRSKNNAKILDLGFGTAPISSKLYKEGFEIWGQDFSEKMLDIAKSLMPNSHLFIGDFNQGLVEEIKNQKFDFIVATYCLHHILNNNQRNELIKKLISLLNLKGQVLIGDVMFETVQDREFCAKDVGSNWDSEENYFIIEEIRKAFPNIKFTKHSYCAGTLVLNKPV